MLKVISNKKIILIDIVVILLAAIIAIVVHALMPADTNVEDFDGVLVKALTFPVVASLYFVLLFTHCAITISYFGKRSTLSGLNIGLRFGIAYAIIYLVAMQEVIISSSPFSSWGADFVVYQLLIGLSDAIPASLLSVVIGYFTLKKNDVSTPKSKLINNILAVCLISAVFIAARAIGYHTGIVASDVASYPVQTYIWTAAFGIGFGIIFILLRPIFINKKFSSVKLSLIAIGLNWIIFNSFIGLIFKGLIWQMLLRSLWDILPFFAITILLNKLYKKIDNKRLDNIGKEN